MPTFTLPTVSDVRDDSRLKPEQVNVDYNSSDLDDDIEQRIVEKSVTVQGKLSRGASPYPWPLTDALVAVAYPAYSEAERAVEIANQASRATEATKLYAIASLYGSAGQLQPAYWRTATQYKEQADAVMADLLESISFVAGEQPGNEEGSGVAVWTLTTGLVVTEDEYSC